MIHALLGLALITGITIALTNSDARYLLGQVMKVVLGLAGMAVCLGFIALVVFATKIH